MAIEIVIFSFLEKFRKVTDSIFDKKKTDNRCIVDKSLAIWHRFDLSH